MRQLLHILKTYKIGVILGIVIALGAMPLTMLALGYTAGCPEIHPCDSKIMMAIDILYAIITPFLLIGGFVESLLGLPKLDESGVVTWSYLAIIPFILYFLLFLSVAALVGVGCQVVTRKLIKIKG